MNWNGDCGSLTNGFSPRHRRPARAPAAHPTVGRTTTAAIFPVRARYAAATDAAATDTLGQRVMIMLAGAGRRRRPRDLRAGARTLIA